MTTREYLTHFYQMELSILDKEEDYEKVYCRLKEPVSQLTSDEKILYDELKGFFNDFTEWHEVKRRLLGAVEERDARTIGFLTKYVDLNAKYYYFDVNGYLCNIDEDAVRSLLNNLLYRLKNDKK